jgi:hypothetical protein
LIDTKLTAARFTRSGPTVTQRLWGHARFVVLAIAAVLAGCVVLASASRAAAPTMGTVAGRIVACGGYGGCSQDRGTVSVFDTHGRRVLQRVNKVDGDFSFKLLPGRYSVVCKPMGSVLPPRRQRRTVRVTAGTVTHLRFVFNI